MFIKTYAIAGILAEPELPLAKQFTGAIGAMRGQFRGKYAEVQTVADTLKEAVDRAQAAEPMNEVMESFQCYSAMTCLAGAIYASIANSEDFDTAMITAVNHSGKSAAVASITGAILGAILTEEELPEFYLESLEAADMLRILADDLAQGSPARGLFDDDWDHKYNQGLPL